MFNLYQIVTEAQGGQALDNLARQFGLSRDQADNAVKALVPALSTAFMAKAAQPGGLGELASSMGDTHHAQTFADAATAQDPATQEKGGAVSESIFGNNAIVEQVVQQASRYTGIPAATLQQMLPVIVSVIVGGVGTLMRNQGMGGFLGQLANSGLGSIFGQFGSTIAPNATTGGAMGDVFSQVLSNFFGNHPNAPTPSAPADGTRQQPSGAAGVPPAMQASMDALSKMFSPGVSTPAAQNDDLGAQIDLILSDKKP